MRCAQPRVSAALLNRCSALRLVTTSSGFFNNKGLVRSMATQAVSEEAHTWLTSLRWAENLQDHTSGNAQGPTPVHICSAASVSAVSRKWMHRQHWVHSAPHIRQHNRVHYLHVYALEFGC
jgi:hypothetical protein